MSVINTNITSMIGQQNLSKSQNSLQTSMERLSSGLRINSAKDDAAGQAIANRMSSQITGLAQAQRNANDGISVAQTAEGALNQVNDNLQRIRELSVQAQNETNSADDLKSIQDEIGQRLGEINRISKETSFNGVDVLASDRALQIQVGANDGEKIEVNLKEINSQTLGLSTFNVDGLESSKLSDALTDAGEADVMQAVNVQANSYDAGAGPNSPVVGEDGVYTTSTGSGFAVKGDDGNYYELDFNASTEKWVWDSSSGTVAETDVNVDDGPVTDLPVYKAFDDTATTWDDGFGAAGTDVTETGTAATGFSIDYSAGLFARNDIENDPASGSGSFAVQGSDGNYYEIDATYTFTGSAGQEDDPSQYGVSFDIDLDPANLVQVSSNNVDGNVSQIAVGEYTVTPEEDLLNEDLTSVPTATGNVYELSSGGENEYAVEGNDGEYYLGTFDPNNGNVTWDSSAGPLDASDVGDEVEEVAVDTVQGNYTGLGSEETLHSYTDSNGDTAYVVKSGSGNDATYTKATLGNVDPVTGDIEITKDTGEDSALSVRSDDPLANLDSALNQVDSLRSELGAVQNRFESAITNLQTNETNLSAARSRIEDADYAVEVANMTRAQILQQAGTSVLAQANQVPQNVLSLLG